MLLCCLKVIMVFACVNFGFKMWINRSFYWVGGSLSSTRKGFAVNPDVIQRCAVRPGAQGHIVHSQEKRVQWRKDLTEMINSSEQLCVPLRGSFHGSEVCSHMVLYFTDMKINTLGQ